MSVWGSKAPAGRDRGGRRCRRDCRRDRRRRALTGTWSGEIVGRRGQAASSRSTFASSSNAKETPGAGGSADLPRPADARQHLQRLPPLPAPPRGRGDLRRRRHRLLKRAGTDVYDSVTSASRRRVRQRRHRCAPSPLDGCAPERPRRRCAGGARGLWLSPLDERPRRRRRSRGRARVAPSASP